MRENREGIKESCIWLCEAYTGDKKRNRAEAFPARMKQRRSEKLHEVKDRKKENKPTKYSQEETREIHNLHSEPSSFSA